MSDFGILWPYKTQNRGPMFYSQLGKTLNQLSTKSKLLELYANILAVKKNPDIAFSSPDKLSSEEKIKRSEIENAYFTLNYYAMLLEEMEASIQILRWFYSSTTLLKKFKLESVSTISADNLEEIIQNICQAKDIFDEHKVRLEQLRKLEKPLQGLFLCLIAAAICGGVMLSLTAFAATGAPLPITILFSIILSMGFSAIVSTLFYGLFDIKWATKESIDLLNEIQIHCDAYTNEVPINFSITEYFYTTRSKAGTTKFGYYSQRNASYSQESDISKTTESCFLKKITPDPFDFTRTEKVMSKTTSHITQLKSHFFKHQDAENKTLAQHACTSFSAIKSLYAG